MMLFAWDPTGLFHFTSNAGGSWSNITPNVNFGDSIRDMDFVSTTTGWVLDTDANGNTNLYRTNNGGSTWTLLFGSPPPPAPTPTPTLNLNGLVTNVNISNTISGTSCSTPDIQVNLTGTITTNGPAIVTYHWEITGDTVQQVLPSASFPFSGAMSQTVGYVFNAPCGNHTILLMVTGPNAMQAQVNIPLSTSTPSPTEFGQTLVATLNAKNFDAAKALMDQSFMMAFWLSQGTPYTPELAIQQLQTNYIGASTVLVADPNKDLNALLGGNPYSIVGLDPSNSLALFVSGWGLDGKDEAILYVTRRADGSLYWHSVLIAKGGFASNSISHDAFCADTSIPILIEQLKGSMNQSNGDMFAGIVSPLHGVDVRLWAYQPAVNFNTTTAQNVFTSTDVYNWGAGRISGSPDFGTFSQVIQPKMQEVLNAPNLKTYCDDLTNVPNILPTPWPYTNIHYYNLYKPSTTGTSLDSRTWLIGFEYINGHPYLYAMVTIIGEP